MQDLMLYAGVAVLSAMGIIVYGKKARRSLFYIMLGLVFINVLFQRAFNVWYFIIPVIVIFVGMVVDVAIVTIRRSYEKKTATIVAEVDKGNVTEAGRQAYMRDNPHS